MLGFGSESGPETSDRGDTPENFIEGSIEPFTAKDQHLPQEPRLAAQWGGWGGGWGTNPPF